MCRVWPGDPDCSVAPCSMRAGDWFARSAPPGAVGDREHGAEVRMSSGPVSSRRTGGSYTMTSPVNSAWSHQPSSEPFAPPARRVLRPLRGRSALRGDPWRIDRTGCGSIGSFIGSGDAIDRDAHAARLGRHRARLDQHLLDSRLRPPAQRADLAGTSMSRRTRICACSPCSTSPSASATRRSSAP